MEDEPRGGRAERRGRAPRQHQPDVDAAGRHERRARIADGYEPDELSATVTQQLAKLARRQGGVVTRAQLLDVGLSASHIQRRVDGAELHRVHRGVYLVGHDLFPPLGREWAAMLACGKGAVVSHVSACGLLQVLRVDPDDDVDITVVGTPPRSRRGIRVRETSFMPSADVWHVRGLPITSPIRTILDLAAADDPRLERALSEAHVRGLIRPTHDKAILTRSKGRRGAQGLRALLEAERSGFTRSEAEREMRKLLRQARLPQPLTNTRIGGYEVDFLWPDHKLVVEVDGYSTHGHRRAFERDRRKDATLLTAGYRVIRITWTELTTQPVAVAATIAAAIAAARAQH